MSDYYPSIRLVVIVFYLASVYFKDVSPFSVWWLIGIVAIDYIIAIILASAMANIHKKLRG